MHSSNGRRTFLKELAGSAGALALRGELNAQIAPQWGRQIGLELYTVRHLLAKDYEGTVARIAKIGYKEVEPADPYNRMEPKAYKALLDRYRLKMYSTHAGAADGPDLEKQLEGFRLMGIRYAGISAPRPAQRPQGGGPRQPRPRQSVDDVARSCAQMNKYGAVLKKFGMKYLIHNHAGEFELLADGKTTQYDVFLKETDPALVAMQLDIGWAYVAGQDVLEMFRKNPGRYELWHVKDAKFKHLDPKLTPAERQRAGKIVTMGEGDIDYKAVFAQAKPAGLKRFVIEQDTAGADGRDAVEDCRIAYENLSKILS